MTIQPTQSAEAGTGLVPTDPFRSLSVHFGMLLGVEDFRTLGAYHRGKQWYHNAWLHGQGVIWGLGVSLSRGPASDEESEGPLTGELKVEPGVALDLRGREVRLDQAACLDLRAWYEAHRDDPAMTEAATVDDATGTVSLSAHIVIAFEACLDRQVPALSEPCDGGSSTTAYSRVVERARLTLRPGAAPDHRASDPTRFHSVRLLMGLDHPREQDGAILASDQAVLDARAEIAALSAAEQPAACLNWLRHFAVLDEIALAPTQASDAAWNLFPVPPPAEVVLAGVNDVRLVLSDSGWTLDNAEIDPFVRPVHLPTSLVQDLVCGGIVSPAVDDRLHVDPETVSLADDRLSFSLVGGPLASSSLSENAITVSLFDSATGWSPVALADIAFDEDEALVTLDLGGAPEAALLRLVVRGTGAFPLLDEDLRSLAGALGSVAPSDDDGTDFVHQIRLAE